MTSSPRFPPLDLGVRFNDDGSGFPAFERAADSAFASVEARQRRFADNMSTAGKTLASALSVPRNSLGALDLNVTGLQDAARKAEQAAAAARELASATRLAATAAGDNSQQARLQVAAMEAVAVEHEQAARAAKAQAAAMEQVQAQLNRTAGAATKLSVTGPGVALAMQAGAKEAGNLRIATIGAGQQLQDLAIQIGSGQRASVAFAQQLPQLAFALSYLEGSSNKAVATVGRFGTLMSGPLGLAIPIVALALGGLASRFGEVDDAAKAAQKASEDFRDGLLDMSKFADQTTGRMIALADATVRAALAMNQLKQQEVANRAKGYETEGVGKVLAYARANTVQTGGRAADGRPNVTSPGVSEALRAAGFRSGLDGASGNLIVLERELQAAAKTRPELKALADEVSVLAAQSIDAAKAMKDLRENAKFLTGERAIVPGFQPPKGKKERTPRERASRETYNAAEALAAWQVDANNDVVLGIAKRLNDEAEKALNIGDEIAEQRAEADRIALENAQRELDLRVQMLGVVEQMGGASGKAAALISGMMTGNFSGLGKLGNALNLGSQLVGDEGWRQITSKLDSIFGGPGKKGAFTQQLAAALPVVGQYIAATSLGTELAGLLGFKTSKTGGLIGGFTGAILGGALKKTKKGIATIGAGADGSLDITSTTGNSKSRIAAASKSGDAVIDSIESIAEQFGASVNAAVGSVSIGIRKGSYRVDPTGRGNTKVKKGGVDFGQDAQAAAEYAMLDLIKDGVLVGLREGTKQLLTNAKELQTGLSKALKFENVFRDLKRLKDPVGAAIDDLDREFKSLISIFKEAGASSAEYAQLEELYNLKRKDAVQQAFESVSSSLKSLLDDIRIGDSGYSLRTRLGNAQAAFDPLAARVQAGDSTAYDAYAQAASQLLDISREFYGSGTGYFDLLQKVDSITAGQLDYQQRLYDSAAGGNKLDFTPLVSATEAGADKVANAVLSGMSAQIAAMNDNSAKTLAALQQLAASGGKFAYIPGLNF